MGVAHERDNTERRRACADLDVAESACARLDSPVAVTASAALSSRMYAPIDRGGQAPRRVISPGPSPTGAEYECDDEPHRGPTCKSRAHAITNECVQRCGLTATPLSVIRCELLLQHESPADRAPHTQTPGIVSDSRRNRAEVRHAHRVDRVRAEVSEHARACVCAERDAAKIGRAH